MEGGRDVLPDEIGLDGKLPVTAVHHHRELDAGGATEVHERIECGTDGAAGEEDIVNEDDLLPSDVIEDVRGLQLRLLQTTAEVIAIERDIETADGNGGVFHLRDLGSDAACEEITARTDADDAKRCGTFVPFEDLVGESVDGTGKPLRIDDELCHHTKTPPIVCAGQ